MTVGVALAEGLLAIRVSPTVKDNLAWHKTWKRESRMKHVQSTLPEVCAIEHLSELSCWSNSSDRNVWVVLTLLLLAHACVGA
jgi:hypothetical protein